MCVEGGVPPASDPAGFCVVSGVSDSRKKVGYD